ncbi:hypothetical protein HDR66_00685 [bacterium]|nr:hypothetical protein [bacterium]
MHIISDCFQDCKLIKDHLPLRVLLTGPRENECLRGWYTCKALRPKCAECPVAHICTAGCKTV